MVEGQWVGTVDGHARRMLVAGDTFFSWYEENFPTRTREAEAVLRALDPDGQLPLASAVGTWNELRGYFIGVAHHRPDVTLDEFDRRLNDLEDFLITRLRPRPFADAARLDSLIEAGERDAER
jgi:hypothetical protein